MNNQFQDFSNQMIAKHKGFGQMFDSAPMVFPELEPAGETGGTTIENHYIKNLYQIQNLTEENHLYHQNLQFVTNILEKKLEQRVVPSVEKLVEKTIQEELPDVEHQVIREMTDRLHTLVKEGGVEQLTVLREQLQKETERQKELIRRETEVRTEKITDKAIREVKIAESKREPDREIRIAETKRESDHEIRTAETKRELDHEIRTAETKRELDHEIRFEQNKTTEITNLTEQEILLRKIENIYYSSTQNHFYGNTGQIGVQTMVQTGEHMAARSGEHMAVQTDVYTSRQPGVETETRPERTESWTWELQNRTLQAKELQAQKVPQRAFDTLHLEYEAQVPEEVTGNTQGSEILVPGVQTAPGMVQGISVTMPDTPEFLKTQERILEQQREIIARQLKEITKLQTQDRQTVTKLQNRVQQSERAEQIETVRTRESENVAESRSQTQIQTRSTVPSAESEERAQPQNRFRNTETQPHMELQEQNILNGQSSVPKYRSRSVFRVEDLKRRRQPAESFQEAELLYSFEQTSDEHWNEIRQEIAKELRNEENKKNQESGKLSEEQNRMTEGTVSGTAGVPAVAPEAEKLSQAQFSSPRQLAERIFRQAGETIRQKTNGTVTIHPAALEYLEQALNPESGQISGTAQEHWGQVQQAVQPVMEHLQSAEMQPSDENTVVVHTIERILDAYRVQREPVKAAARSVKPKTVMMQMAGQPETTMIQAPAGVQLGGPENARMQSQAVSQPGAVRPQVQMAGQPGAVRVQSGTVMIQLSGTPAKGAMEQAPMIYPEEVSPEEQAEQSRKIEKQIHEITQNIKEVKKSTVVHQEILTEQQKEVVREVIRQAPETVKEKDVSTLIRRQVQREVETQVDASLGQMTNRVYRRIEEKLRTERGRRGLL